MSINLCYTEKCLYKCIWKNVWFSRWSIHQQTKRESPDLASIHRFSSFLQILPGLFVGNVQDSKDAKQMDIHRITHILAIHDDAKRLFKVRNIEITRQVSSMIPSASSDHYFHFKIVWFCEIFKRFLRYVWKYTISRLWLGRVDQYLIHQNTSIILVTILG